MFVDLCVLEGPERDLTVFGKCQSVYNKNNFGDLSQELIPRI